MMTKLTKIELLDQQFPGLADEVRKWFAQGVTCIEIAERLRERYQVEVTRTAVGSFRSRRWVPEQALLREKRIEAQAARDVERERAMKAILAGESSGETQ